jgi:hypothetical protein
MSDPGMNPGGKNEYGRITLAIDFLYAFCAKGEFSKVGGCLLVSGCASMADWSFRVGVLTTFDGPASFL